MAPESQINHVIVEISMDATETDPKFIVGNVTAQPGRCFEGAENLLRARFECLCCKTGYVVLPQIMQTAPTRTEMEVSVAENDPNPLQEVVEHVSEDEIGSYLDEVVDSDEKQKQDDEFDDFKMEAVSSLHGGLLKMAAIENQTFNSVIVKINMDATESNSRFVVEELTAQPGSCFDGAEKLHRARFECLCCKTGYVVLPLIMQTAPIRTEMEVSIAEDDPIQIQHVEYNSEGETGSTLDEVVDSNEEQMQSHGLEDSAVEVDMIFPMDVDQDPDEMSQVEHPARVEQTSESEESVVLTPSEERSLKLQCLQSKVVVRLVRVDEEPQDVDAFVAPAGSQKRNVEGGYYTCDICKSSIKNRRDLYTHMKIHLGTRYSCTECQESFSRNFYLITHKKLIHQNELRICEVCGWSQTCTKSEYYSHLRRRHPEFRNKGFQPKVQNFNAVDFPCVYCEPQASFTSFEELQEHLGGTHDRNFVCTRCPKAFAHKHSLKNHIESVHEKKKFKCPKCDKVFTWKKDLNTHLRTHNMSEPISKEKSMK